MPEWRRGHRPRSLRRQYAERIRHTVEPFVGVLRSQRRAKRWCGEAARTQGGRGIKGCRVGESILGTGMSQNLSRGSDTLERPLTTQLFGANEAQRSLHPNDCFTSCKHVLATAIFFFECCSPLLPICIFYCCRYGGTLLSAR